VANLPANSAALKVEPKISKQPYSDAAYSQALQQVGGTATSSLSTNGVIVPSGRPQNSGLSATSGAQPPLTGLPSLPPSTSTSASAANPAPTKIAVTPPLSDAEKSAQQAARAAAASAAAAAASAAAASAAAPPATPPPLLTSATAAAEAAALASTDMPAWIWPLAATTKPRITATFTDLNKGIDVSGTRGQGVLAAAPGKVVYSGTAMRGYGQLVIVKHNVAWFSAYAHNDKILVAEGDSVKKGQKIAEMGATDADSVKLHFEIRKQGVPMDPLKFLPPL
jgi:lipoprotein NlpD